jgi:pimeloyl-ACP methyl ester carboxylesterase
MTRTLLSRILPRVAAACALLCLGAFAVVAQSGGKSGAKSASGLAEVNGTRLYYEAAGEGTAVVLVHGGLVDARLWDAQMGPLSKRLRVVRYDLRGFGRSAAATEPFSHLEDLRALLDFLKIERASLVGLSLGGIIAADFALEHPGRVDRLVLVGPGLRGDKQPPPKDTAAAVEAMSRGAEAFADATMTRELYAAVRPGSDAYKLLRRMLLDNFKALSTFRLMKSPEPPTAERLGQIKAPTLVVIGGRDGTNLLNIADTIAAGVPGARKVTIQGSSHHPPVEKPKELNRALLDFLVEGKEK